MGDGDLPSAGWLPKASVAGYSLTHYVTTLAPLKSISNYVYQVKINTLALIEKTALTKETEETKKKRKKENFRIKKII